MMGTIGAEVVAHRKTRHVRSRAITVLAVVLPAVLALAVLLVVARPALAATVSGSPDVSIQTDGQVRAILTVGDKIYIGGTFTNVINPDGTVVARRKLAAIDANTGALTNWQPRASSTVYALAASPDGSRIYAGGAFTNAWNGATRVAHNHVAAIDAATGKVDHNWNAGADLTVYAIDTLGTRVYLGGVFRYVNGQIRPGLAAVDGATGALDPNWKPKADRNVRALMVSPDATRIFVGGGFDSISGQPRHNLGSVDPVMGAPDAWTPNPCYPVYDLDVAGTSVYVAGGGTPATCGAGGFAEAFDAVAGNSLWQVTSDGDFQGVAVLGDTVYYGGHQIQIPWVPAPGSGESYKRFAAMDAATGELDQTWRPAADAGVWPVTADLLRNRIYAGGPFTTVNGEPHQGFVQFSSGL